MAFMLLNLQDKGRRLIPLCLGQILSLCITGTSVASSALWTHYSYTLGDSGVMAAASSLIINQIATGAVFFGFSFADVQANILAVLAFKSTSVLSALIVSSWTLPCIMLLSTLFLGYRYYAGHFGGVILCLSGLFMLIYADTVGDSASKSNHSWIGDLICLTSATLYAISNVTEEYLVHRCTTEEFLSRTGLFGSILSGIQALIFEFHNWMAIEWRWEVVGLIMVYVASLSCMYSLVPTLYRISNATFISMSLMTSNFYSLLAGLLFLDAKMPSFYPVAYILVICGVMSYNMTTPPQTSQRSEYQPLAKNDEENRYLCM